MTALGEAAQLTALVSDDAGGVVSSASIDWTSLHPAIVSVTNSGVVTAIANGAASVTAAAGTFTDTVTVTVEQVPASVVVTSSVDTLTSEGETAQLTAEVLDGNGYPVAVGGSWSSSDEAVLTVDASGLVSAVAAGAADVTYDVDGGVSGFVTLVVDIDTTPATVSVSFDYDTIFAAGGVLATAIVQNATGGEIPDVSMTWTASDPSVTLQDVRIDSTGRSVALFHSSGAVGTVWIRAETPEAVIDSAAVEVVPPPAAQGISIDFETLPNGLSTCTSTYINGGCNFGDDLAAWGITFRWFGSVAGGDGTPNLVKFDSGKTLINDRSSAGFVTGGHRLMLSVDVAEIAFFNSWPPAAVTPELTLYDKEDEVVESAVVVRAELAEPTVQNITIHSPVLIEVITIGPSNGLLYLDDIVY